MPLFAVAMLLQPGKYLRAQRKRWGLTQPELANLLGVTVGSISRYETDRALPPASLILCEIIFGSVTADNLPKSLMALEDVLSNRVLTLHNKLKDKTDAASLKKLELLEQIPGRIHQVLPTHESA